MADYQRLAIMFVPDSGPLADFGASWFGWDCRHGRPVPEMWVDGLTPRPFAGSAALVGFQAALKPPFLLAQGMSAATLDRTLAGFAAEAAPLTVAPLQLDRLDRKVVLLAPESRALSDLAADLVIRFDHYRAEGPPDTSPARLSPRQQSLKARWGDPRVLDEFRFRFVLTDDVDAQQADQVTAALGPMLAPLLAPFTLDSIALTGERLDGRFQVLHRYPLGGSHIRDSAISTEFPAGSRT